MPARRLPVSWWWTKLFEKKLAVATTDYLRRMQAPAVAPVLNARNGILLGYAGSQPVTVPLEDLIAHSICTGSSGAGKTIFDCIVIEALLQHGLPFGVIDPKGELFDRALYLSAAYGQLHRTVIIDFGNRTAISPYNILAPWGDDFDFFIHSRLETLKELLPGRDKLSLRATGALKECLVLLAESSHPIPDLLRVLEDASLRARLVRASRCLDLGFGSEMSC